MSRSKWILIVALALTGCGPCGYNRIVQEEQQVEQSWSQVENQMQRRADLIPNLVETAKGYAAHETEVFNAIANARSAMLSASSRAEKMDKSNQLDGALSRLLAIRESYPELHSDAQFTRLMDELAGTENRLAVERKRYNEAVQIYNTDVKQIPGAWFAKLGSFPKQKDYFRESPAAQAVPQVHFETPQPAPAAAPH